MNWWAHALYLVVIGGLIVGWWRTYQSQQRWYSRWHSLQRRC